MYHKEMMQNIIYEAFHHSCWKQSIVNKIALISNNGKYEKYDSFNSIQTLKRTQGLVSYLGG